MGISSHWVAGSWGSEVCHSSNLTHVCACVCVYVCLSVLETNHQKMQVRLGQTWRKQTHKTVFNSEDVRKTNNYICFPWLVGCPSLGFPLWIAWWEVMKGLKRKTPIMRSCSCALLNAMWGAYHRAHKDPTLSVINALRACAAAPELPNEKKMAFCNFQHSLKV